MTARQRALANLVESQRDGLLNVVRRELLDQPVGYSTIVRLRQRFVPHMTQVLSKTLLVTKTPTGFDYIEYEFPRWRKGWAAPKPREL